MRALGILACLTLLLTPGIRSAHAATAPGTVIELTASATVNGVMTYAKPVYLIVVNAHKFRSAPSAASILTYRGTLVSYVYGGVRLVGILTSDGRVFRSGVVYAPERW